MGCITSRGPLQPQLFCENALLSGTLIDAESFRNRTRLSCLPCFWHLQAGSKMNLTISEKKTQSTYLPSSGGNHYAF